MDNAKDNGMEINKQIDAENAANTVSTVNFNEPSNEGRNCESGVPANFNKKVIKESPNKEAKEVGGNASESVKNNQNWNKKCSWNLVLLNDENSILPGQENPPLENYDGKKVHAKVLSYLKNMIEAAKKDGKNLWVSSCYRSIDYQKQLHNVKINYYLKQGYNRPEAEKLARKVVAAPGTSEHNLGIAVDFNGVKDDFYKTEEYKWLTEHADEYGFILRYTKEKQNITKKIYEPWHFRYVGKEHAKAMKRMGLCLEEYIDFLKNQRLN